MIAGLSYLSDGYGFGWSLADVYDLDARDRAIYAELLEEFRTADAEAIRNAQRGGKG